MDVSYYSNDHDRVSFFENICVPDPGLLPESQSAEKHNVFFKR